MAIVISQRVICPFLCRSIGGENENVSQSLSFMFYSLTSKCRFYLSYSTCFYKALIFYLIQEKFHPFYLKIQLPPFSAFSPLKTVPRHMLKLLLFIPMCLNLLSSYPLCCILVDILILPTNLLSFTFCKSIFLIFELLSFNGHIYNFKTIALVLSKVCSFFMLSMSYPIYFFKHFKHTYFIFSLTCFYYLQFLRRHSSSDIQSPDSPCFLFSFHF